MQHTMYLVKSFFFLSLLLRANSHWRYNQKLETSRSNFNHPAKPPSPTVEININDKFPNSNVEARSSDKASCDGSTEKECVFPYIFGRRGFNSCNNYDGDDTWCPTEVNEEGAWEPSLGWAYCDESCPGVASVNETTLSNIMPQNLAPTDCCKTSTNSLLLST